MHAPESSESLGVAGMFWVSSCEFSMVLRELMMDKVMNHTQKCVVKDMDFQSISGCAGWSMICLKYWTIIYIYIDIDIPWFMMKSPNYHALLDKDDNPLQSWLLDSFTIETRIVFPHSIVWGYDMSPEQSSMIEGGDDVAARKAVDFNLVSIVCISALFLIDRLRSAIQRDWNQVHRSLMAKHGLGTVNTHGTWEQTKPTPWSMVVLGFRLAPVWPPYTWRSC